MHSNQYVNEDQRIWDNDEFPDSRDVQPINMLDAPNSDHDPALLL